MKTCRATGKADTNCSFNPFPENVTEGLMISNDIDYQFMYGAFDVTRRLFPKILGGNINAGSGITIGEADFVKAMWYAANNISTLRFWMDNLSLSISNQLRKPTPSPDRKPSFSTTTLSEFAGTMYISTNVYVVRRAWICLPALLVVAANFLLATIILLTARHPASIGVWKGSPLMYLFCQLDDTLGGVVDQSKHTAVPVPGQEVIDGTKNVKNLLGDSMATLVRTPEGDWNFQGSHRTEPALTTSYHKLLPVNVRIDEVDGEETS